MKLRVLFLSILLLGCLDCKQAPDAELRDKCFSSLALRSGDAKACNDVQNLTTRSYCVMRIALTKLDEQECANIETSLRAQCEQVVKGVKQNNSLVCMLVKDNVTADICRMRVG
jgi:hypothetical protein